MSLFKSALALNSRFFFSFIYFSILLHFSLFFAIFYEVLGSLRGNKDRGWTKNTPHGGIRGGGYRHLPSLILYHGRYSSRKYFLVFGQLSDIHSDINFILFLDSASRCLHRPNFIYKKGGHLFLLKFLLFIIVRSKNSLF